MRLGKLTISNFLSFGPNNVIDLDNRGITFIKGDNRDTSGSNGSGKSTIHEAIVWTLFGDTTRGIGKVDDVVNKEIGKNCFCSLEIDDSVITRYRKHDAFGNGVKYVKNNIDKTNSDARKTQKEINLDFKIEFSAFINSIVLSPDNKISFLDDKNANYRRAVIETILGIDLYKNYLIVAKENIRSLELKREQNNSALESYKKQLEQYKAKIEEVKIKRDEFHNSIEIKKQSINEALNKLKSIDVNKQLEIYDHIKKAHTVLSQLNSKLLLIGKENMMSGAEIDNCRKQIEKYKTLTVRACEYCGSTLDADKIKNIIDPIDIKIQNLQKKIDENKAQSSELKGQYSAIEQSIEKFKPELAERELYVIDANIKSLMANLEEVAKQQNPYELIDFTQDINDINSEIAKCEENLKTLLEDLNYYKFWEIGFGNSGLKTYIIDDIIGYFNKRIEFYLDILSANNIKIFFDKYLEFTIDGLNYRNCSSGERKRVDIATLLALHDLNNIRHGCNTNVLILDEVFDSIDEIGINCVNDALLELNKTIPSIFVISHNNSLSQNFNNIITVVKENKVSYIL